MKQIKESLTDIRISCKYFFVTLSPRNNLLNNKCVTRLRESINKIHLAVVLMLLAQSLIVEIFPRFAKNITILIYTFYYIHIIYILYIYIKLKLNLRFGKFEKIENNEDKSVAFSVRRLFIFVLYYCIFIRYTRRTGINKNNKLIDRNDETFFLAFSVNDCLIRKKNYYHDPLKKW